MLMDINAAPGAPEYKTKCSHMRHSFGSARVVLGRGVRMSPGSAGRHSSSSQSCVRGELHAFHFNVRSIVAASRARG